MRARNELLCALIFGITAACGGDAVDDRGGVFEDELVFQTGEFEVGLGDVFECFYTDVITDRELATTGAFGIQEGSGGHHITVYYTTETKAPEHHPCSDEEMFEWQQIGATGSEAASDLVLPEGLAIRIPAGAQIVLQAHYINVTGERYTVDEQAGIHLVDPARVSEYVRQFTVFDPDFSVPPHTKMERTKTCTLDRDLQLVKLLGHMHEWGTHYRLEEVDESGELIRLLIDDEVTPIYASHPPIASFEMDDPLFLAEGTRLRQTCAWDNFEDYELVFPREMCLAFGLHFGGPEEDVRCVVD